MNTRDSDIDSSAVVGILAVDTFPLAYATFF